MTKGTDGLPDRLKARPFVSDAAGPVDLQLSPQGELFYADLNGGTIRRVVYETAAPSTCPDGQYQAQYFPNTTLTGTAASQLCEPAPLNHDWGAGGPAGVGVDGYSARWTGRMSFPSNSTYTFTAVTDDGMRVWIDGQVLIDQWRNQLATFTASRALTAGNHDIRIDYFETNQGAVAKFSWTGGVTNAPPTPTITTPAAGTTWKVGDTITFNGVGDRPGGRRPAGQQPVVGDGPPALPRRLSRPPGADLVGGERGIDHRAGSRVPGLPGTPPDRDGQERPDRDRQQATGSADRDGHCRVPAVGPPAHPGIADRDGAVHEDPHRGVDREPLGAFPAVRSRRFVRVRAVVGWRGTVAQRHRGGDGGDLHRYL